MAKRDYQNDSFDPKKTARIIAASQPVSLKFSVELLREMKGRPLSKSEAFLERILEKKDFLPLRKYNRKVAHRKGEPKSLTKSGRYPLRLARVFLKIISNLKANADYKGMNAKNLLLVHGFASEGLKRFSNQSQGRISGKIRKKKSTHIELVAVEAA